MKIRNLLLSIFAFFLLIQSAYAVPLLMRETFDGNNGANWSVNPSDSITNELIIITASNSYNNNPTRYVHNITKTTMGTLQNITVNFQFQGTSTNGAQMIYFGADNSSNPYGVGSTHTIWEWQVVSGKNHFQILTGQTGVTNITFGNSSNTPFNFTAFFNWSETSYLQVINVYVNGTFIGNASTNMANRWSYLIFASQTGGASATYKIDNISACNSTKVDFGCIGLVITPDTTPPSINYYNLTNEAGCENWVTDKTNACSTSSVTPTVQFNTDEPAWCAIAGSSSSTSLNINYTEMQSSRNCAGDMSGEGSIEHRCTLTPQDELVYDASYLFISCKDANNNMNRSGTSTSGALKLSITSLESTGRDSIGIGIQNALLSGYINYTDQQIYARNLSNAQAKGTFDRAAKKGSKMWAFNRIGVSDSYVDMFNLTPVLYNLELANKTSTNITKQVELLINATK